MIRACVYQPAGIFFCNRARQADGLLWRTDRRQGGTRDVVGSSRASCGSHGQPRVPVPATATKVQKTAWLPSRRADRALRCGQAHSGPSVRRGEAPGTPDRSRRPVDKPQPLPRSGHGPRKGFQAIFPEGQRPLPKARYARSWAQNRTLGCDILAMQFTKSGIARCRGLPAKEPSYFSAISGRSLPPSPNGCSGRALAGPALLFSYSALFDEDLGSCRLSRRINDRDADKTGTVWPPCDFPLQ